MDINLVRNYIRFKASAERHIGNPWKDEELKAIVHKEIAKLNIVELLHEAVDEGTITCPQCKSQLFPTNNCNKCRWQNPIVYLNIL